MGHVNQLASTDYDLSHGKGVLNPQQPLQCFSYYKKKTNIHFEGYFCQYHPRPVFRDKMLLNLLVSQAF